MIRITLHLRDQIHVCNLKSYNSWLLQSQDFRLFRCCIAAGSSSQKLEKSLRRPQAQERYQLGLLAPVIHVHERFILLSTETPLIRDTIYRCHCRYFGVRVHMMKD